MHPGRCGSLDRLSLTERGDHYHGGKLLPADLLGCRQPVAPGHRHVEQHHVRAQRPRQRHRGLAVRGLADDVISLFTQHLDEIHADQRLIFGDHNGPGVGHVHQPRCARLPFSSRPGTPTGRGSRLKLGPV